MVWGSECDPHAGIMLEEFDLVLRNRNVSKKTSKPSPLKSQNLTVRRERGDLDKYGVNDHHVF